MPSRAEASRINGSKSGGPKTEGGRLAVLLNAVKHGLTAETVVLANESAEQYQSELDYYLRHFAPANKPEDDLVRQLASAHWRLARYTGIETSLLDIEMEKKRKYVKEVWKNIGERGRLGLAFDSLSGAHSSLALLNRYQARLHHEYQRILKSLLQLQASRAGAEPKITKRTQAARKRAHSANPLRQRTSRLRSAHNCYARVLENAVLQWVATYGYFAIFSLLVLGIVGLPVPDEFLLTGCGFLVYQGHLRLIPTFASALAGSMSGITCSYLIGRTVGWKFLHSRVGRWLHIRDRDIRRVHDWSDRHRPLGPHHRLFHSRSAPLHRHRRRNFQAGISLLRPVRLYGSDVLGQHVRVHRLSFRRTLAANSRHGGA